MIQMINYSDRAIALTGDTKEYKDELKAAGGSFNARLSCGAGWIFSKRREAELVALVARLNGLDGTGFVVENTLKVEILFFESSKEEARKAVIPFINRVKDFLNQETVALQLEEIESELI